MKKPGVYYNNNTGHIWLVEKIEHHPKMHELQPFEFSLILRGSWHGKTSLNRCIIRKSQYKYFTYLGKP